MNMEESEKDKFTKCEVLITQMRNNLKKIYTRSKQFKEENQEYLYSQIGRFMSQIEMLKELGENIEDIQIPGELVEELKKEGGSVERYNKELNNICVFLTQVNRGKAHALQQFKDELLAQVRPSIQSDSTPLGLWAENMNIDHT